MTADDVAARIPGQRIALIWAQDRAGIIGDGAGMPWRLPEDLAHFRQLTTGRPVIMGRRTWESLPPRFRPLPGRCNIVLTRTPSGELTAGAEVEGQPEVQVATGLDEALRMAGDGLVWVIGGGEVYRQTMPRADRCEVTVVDVDAEVASPVTAPQPTAEEGWTAESEGQWLTSREGTDASGAPLRYRFTGWRRRT